MSKPIDLTGESFQKEVLESELPVLVDFWAPWCVPCQMMAPVLEQLAAETEGKLKVAKLDVNDPAHEDLARQYQIAGIPSLKIFKRGKVVKEMTGMRGLDQLKSEVTEFIS